LLKELFEYDELNEIMIAVIILEIEEAVIIFLENNPIINPIGAIINQVKIDENSILEIKLKDKLIFINMIEINNKYIFIIITKINDAKEMPIKYFISL
jgi:hypothetical protein